MAQQQMLRQLDKARAATRLMDMNAALSAYTSLYYESLRSKSARTTSTSGATTTTQALAPSITATTTTAAGTILLSPPGASTTSTFSETFVRILLSRPNLALFAFTVLFSIAYSALRFHKNNGHWPWPNWHVIGPDLQAIGKQVPCWIVCGIFWLLEHFFRLVFWISSALWPRRAIAFGQQHLTIAKERWYALWLRLSHNHTTESIQRACDSAETWIKNHMIHGLVLLVLAWFVASYSHDRPARVPAFVSFDNWYDHSDVWIPAHLQHASTRMGRQPELLSAAELALQCMSDDEIVSSSTSCERCQSVVETAVEDDLEVKSVVEVARETFEASSNPTALVENVRVAVTGSVYCMTCKQWHCCELPY